MTVEWGKYQEAYKAIHDAIVTSPEVWLGYNANSDLVEIRKKIGGKWYSRPVRFDGVTDFTVVKWDKFEGWSEVT